MRRLALPAIAHSLLQTLVFVVDRATLGRHGETSLAAMQIAGPLEWSLWSVFSAFEVGTIARVGRHVGARRPERARAAALASLGMAVTAGGAVALLSPLFLSSLGAIAPGASASVVVAARDYLGVTLAATPVVFVAVTAIATLQAGGDTRTPLAIGIVANLVHVPLNRLLILGGLGVPAMGARGCGISTSVTFILEATLALIALSRRDRPVSLARDPSSAEAPPGEAGEVLRVALPSLLERLLYHAGFFGYVLIIMRLGDRSMAANQALISVESVCFLSGDGFGIAAAALVAQRLGAERPDQAERGARLAIRYAVILLSTMGLFFLVTRRLVLPAFSRDLDVIAAGAAVAPVLAIAQPFMAIGLVLGQALRGAGYTRAVLGVSAASALVVRVSCTYVFAISLGLGLTGVWMGSTADWMVRTCLLALVGRGRVRALASKRA